MAILRSMGSSYRVDPDAPECIPPAVDQVSDLEDAMMETTLTQPTQKILKGLDTLIAQRDHYLRALTRIALGADNPQQIAVEALEEK